MSARTASIERCDVSSVALGGVIVAEGVLLNTGTPERSIRSPLPFLLRYRFPQGFPARRHFVCVYGKGVSAVVNLVSDCLAVCRQSRSTNAARPSCQAADAEQKHRKHHLIHHELLCSDADTSRLILPEDRDKLSG